MLSAFEKQALAHVDDDELIAWVQALTQIPSVWHPQNGAGEEEAARWVEARCLEMGLKTYFQIVERARPNVIAVHQGPTVGPTLMFEGHTDVVTEGDASLWTYPPFSATIRDGRIFGRGANDMKAGLVCALMATKAIVRSGVRLKGSILIGALCDEEGQMLGVKHFVEQEWADCVTAAIICEPEENHLCVTQKGVMWLRVTIQGKMAHGAMPLSGLNSIYPMARFLELVRDLEQREIALHQPDEFLGQPSITPTILRSPRQGEPQKNVMPAAAEVVLDCRLIPSQDPEALAGEVERRLAAATAEDERLSYQLEVLEVRQPTWVDRNEAVVLALASSYRDLTGREPIYGGVPGSTDGTILNASKGIPIVTCGPGDIHIPHQVDEWVSIEEVKLAARLYVVAAMRFLGVDEHTVEIKEADHA